MPRVRLIAPSGHAADPAAMTRGVARLRAAGYAVENEAVLDRAELRFAGSDADRAADINALARLDTLPDIALVTRGGYGAARLLEHLHYDALRERLAGSTLAMVGHSDFTAVQLALHARSALVTFSGPLLADLGAEPEDAGTLDQFRRVLSAPSAEVRWACGGDASLDVEGPLWGGNLAVLCSLLGTPYFPRIDGGILCVEDVGEPPFRIERLFYHLHLSGVLGRQRALVLGRFSDCRPGPRDNGYTLDAVFTQLRAVAGIPVIDGLPHGHGTGQLTLPFGAPARLRVEGPGARLGFSGYPHHG
ncbi:MAG: LD-carboxypeptidase [Xanthomonadaceae bacterium]|nr:LD-carboxypeptidase [Xanthomonadaceae bacterium]MDE1962399.1 LD-carboxypeptidase [Xanthomonadaceae bacterium]